MITASRSLIVFNFEAVGTAITSASRKNAATGFAFVISKVDLFSARPPGIAKPVMSNISLRFFSPWKYPTPSGAFEKYLTVYEPSKPSALSASPTAIAVVPYPPPIFDDDTNSIEVSGLRSLYPQTLESFAVPNVAVMQVRSEPSTPRPAETKPAAAHCNPAAAFPFGTAAPCAATVPLAISATLASTMPKRIPIFLFISITPNLVSPRGEETWRKSTVYPLNSQVRLTSCPHANTLKMARDSSRHWNSLLIYLCNCLI